MHQFNALTLGLATLKWNRVELDNFDNWIKDVHFSLSEWFFAFVCSSSKVVIVKCGITWSHLACHSPRCSSALNFIYVHVTVVSQCHATVRIKCGFTVHDIQAALYKSRRRLNNSSATRLPVRNFQHSDCQRFCYNLSTHWFASHTYRTNQTIVAQLLPSRRIILYLTVISFTIIGSSLGCRSKGNLSYWRMYSMDICMCVCMYVGISKLSSFIAIV